MKPETEAHITSLTVIGVNRPSSVLACCAARNQPGLDAVAGLQVELGLGSSPARQVRSQRRLGNCFGIVVVVLLPLHEGFDVDRRDDPRLVAKSA